MLEIVARNRADAAGRPAALPDGRRHAGRSARSGGARHRHVRLRAADAQRPPRHGLHPLRRDQSRPTRATPTIRVRSTRRARIPRRAPIRAPICIISPRPTRCWARCCCRPINLAYYQTLMAGMREAIAGGRFADFRDANDGAMGAGGSAGALERQKQGLCRLVRLAKRTR